MKRILAVVVMALAVAGVSFAGTPEQQVVVLSPSLGTGSVTNPLDYVVKQLVCIDIINGLAAINTCTVSRVWSSGAYTQTVATIVTASSGAHVPALSTNQYYLYKSDVLNFAMAPITTGATVVVTYNNQP